MHLEAELFETIAGFERVAASLYGRLAPELLTPAKQALLAGFAARADVPCLDGYPELLAARDGLVAVANGPAIRDVLLVQGLILEPLASIVYRTLSEQSGVSDAGRTLAALGTASAVSVERSLRLLIENHVGRGDQLFRAFVTVTRPVLGRLDTFGEAVDEVFGEAFGLRFADVVGELGGELLPVMTGLGVERRKLVVHLAQSLMGAGSA